MLLAWSSRKTFGVRRVRPDRKVVVLHHLSALGEMGPTSRRFRTFFPWTCHNPVIFGPMVSESQKQRLIERREPCTQDFFNRIESPGQPASVASASSTMSSHVICPAKCTANNLINCISADPSSVARDVQIEISDQILSTLPTAEITTVSSWAQVIITSNRYSFTHSIIVSQREAIVFRQFDHLSDLAIRTSCTYERHYERLKYESRGENEELRQIVLVPFEETEIEAR